MIGSTSKPVKDDTCAICLNEYTNPVPLPCSHTFCAECIRNYQSHRGSRPGSEVGCPLCRTDVPDDLTFHLLEDAAMIMQRVTFSRGVKAGSDSESREALKVAAKKLEEALTISPRACNVKLALAECCSYLSDWERGAQLAQQIIDAIESGDARDDRDRKYVIGDTMLHKIHMAKAINIMGMAEQQKATEEKADTSEAEATVEGLSLIHI